MDNDTISRQAALNELTLMTEKHKGDTFSGELLHWTGIKTMIENLPSVSLNRKQDGGKMTKIVVHAVLVAVIYQNLTGILTTIIIRIIARTAGRKWRMERICLTEDFGLCRGKEKYQQRRNAHERGFPPAAASRFA